MVVPAKLIVITPPNAQLHIDELLSAGWPPISTVGEPGAHGATVTGVHGIGVNTPSAAAVAEATAGLERLMHTPKGGMFANGLLSMIVAAGLFSIIKGGPVGITIRLLGAAPNEHISEAVAITG